MKTQNNTRMECEQIRHSILFDWPVVGLIATIAVMLLCCPTALAETYEVIEDGEVYLVEVIEEVVAAPKPKDPNEHAANISKKYDDIHKNLGFLLDTASTSTNIFNDKQIKKFENYKKEKNRSENAKKRIDEKGGFKKIGRKNDFDKKNKNKPNKYDEKAYEDFEESLDDLNDILVDAENDVYQANMAKKKYMLLKQSGPPDKCNDLVEASTALRISAAALEGSKIGSQTLLDICSAASGTTTGGFSFDWVCAILGVTTGALDLAATGCDTADQWISSDLEAACMDQIDDGVVSIVKVTEGTAADVNDLSAAVEDLNEAIEDLNDRMDDLEEKIDDEFAELNAKLDAKFAYIEMLLKMPQGKREDFPLKEK